MKKTLSAILLFVSLIVPATTKQLCDNPPIEIIITPGANTGNGPRSTSIIPIQATIYNGYIWLEFNDDLGCIDVIVEESSAGIVLHSVINSSDYSSAIIPFNNEEQGYYSITFTLQSGPAYYGHFII